MAIIPRALCGVFVALPSLAFGLYMLLTSRGEYYEVVYDGVAAVYLAASLLLGATLAPRFRRLWVGLFLAGALAWLAALLTLALLNATPLCVGQDNGDGRNDFFLCVFQTAAVAAVSTPPLLMLLGLSAALGAVILRRQSPARH